MQGTLTLNGYPGDPIHVDQLTIPGAIIQTLHHASMCGYSGEHRQVDVLLIAGLNDLLKDRTVKNIMNDIKQFKESVENLLPSFTNLPASGHSSLCSEDCLPSRRS